MRLLMTIMSGVGWLSDAHSCLLFLTNSDWTTEHSRCFLYPHNFYFYLHPLVPATVKMRASVAAVLLAFGLGGASASAIAGRQASTLSLSIPRFQVLTVPNLFFRYGMLRHLHYWSHTHLPC